MTSSPYRSPSSITHSSHRITFYLYCFKNKTELETIGVSCIVMSDVSSFVQQVCLRNNPLYHAGAVAFSVNAGVPKVGVLLESVWNMNDSCRFQLRSPESLKSMEKSAKAQETKYDPY